MVRTRDELLNAIKGKIGDDVSDDSLQLIEDLTDTLSDYDTKVNDTTNWKEKYEQNDNEWRQKYRDRFFNSGSEELDDESKKPEQQKPLRFEDLFK